MMMKKQRLLFRVMVALTLVVGLMLTIVPSGKAQTDTDWSTPINLSASGVATNPVTVVDLHGIIHAIWADEVDGYKYSQSADGITWTTPILVDFPFGPKDGVPVLLADSNGSIHAFWIGQFKELYYGQSTPETFSKPYIWRTKSRLSRNVSNFDVGFDSNGILHLAYIVNATEELRAAGVYYRQSIIGGGFWLDAVEIYLSEYFRGTTSLNSNVRVAIAEPPGKKKIYISWDNRPQKRIFLASSEDAGLTWSEALQFKGPDDTGRYDSPFNLSIWASGTNALVMWQVGEPGSSKCSVFSQWSEDEGQTWGNTFTLLGGPTACPTGIKFSSVEDGQVAVLLMNLGDPTLLAWNGKEWSEPQSQIRLPALSDPDTYNAIQLGCRQDVIYKSMVFVIGCDQGKGSDIWFLSRTLVPVKEWFKPLSVWGAPTTVEIKDHAVSFLSSATDREGNIHVVWVKTPIAQNNTKPSIQYTYWNGVEWSNPETIIRNLSGEPLQLTMYIDSKNRLMMVWVDGSTGDVLYSWANLDQAGLPSGWEDAKVIPSPSQLNSSPDIVVDQTGRIIVAYAVPLNENRGVYIAQSTDSGFSWSPYIQAFDAALFQWGAVDDPKITLSGDGVLHLLMTRQSMRVDQPQGLYYSRSEDGGVTWSDPQIASEGAISWSDMVSYDDHTVHRVWQEANSLVVANLSQVSQDSGKNWGKLLDVTGVSERISPAALASNGIGQLYFIQLVEPAASTNGNEEDVILQDWKWDGSSWSPESIREMNFRGSDIQYSIAAGITTNNYLGVSMSVNYSEGARGATGEIISFNRFLAGIDDQGNPVASIIPTPFFASDQPVDLPTALPAPTADFSVLNDSNDPSEGTSRNLVGALLVGVVMIAGVLLFLRQRKKSR
jgi:hypothetical protein